MSKFKKIAFGAATMGSLLIPALALAQLTNPTTPPGITGNAVNLSTFETIIGDIAGFLIAVSMIIAVIFIIWGGVMYMTAGSDEAKASEAKSRIKNGIIGAAVVLAVGLILSTVTQLVGSPTTFFQ